MLRPGDRLGRYQVVAPLGAGGMGEVYRAADTRLGREVALKVLPEDVAADTERVARLEVEARALARLRHPGVLEVYDIGEARGLVFLVTELLEGETLRARLARGALPWREAVEVAARIADALAAAHAAGVVHRDLKPENVMLLPGGGVKVLDFGLARLTADTFEAAQTVSSPAGGTTAGTVLGTFGYMAPEQARGDPADARADLFALGCVLHEMLTGRALYRRATAADTIAALLTEPPPPLEPARGPAPAELGAVVARCLEKDPAKRFQSASDLAFALRALVSGAGAAPAAPARPTFGRLRLAAIAAAAVLAAAAAVLLLRGQGPPRARPPGPARVAVLPLDTGGDASLAAAAAAITDAILADPKAAPGVELLAGARADARIEGRVVRLGGAAQATLHLTDREGRVLATAGPAEVDPARPEAAAARLRRRILGAAAAMADPMLGLELFPPPDLDAYLELRLARQAFASDYEAAERHFRRALELDPRFTQAWLGLASAFLNRGRCAEAAATLSSMEAALHRPTEAELLLLRAYRAGVGRRWLEAAAAFEELASRHPDAAWFQYEAARNETLGGRPGRALAWFESVGRSWAGDPVSPMAAWPYRLAAVAAHMRGDPARALAIAGRASDSFPGELRAAAEEAAALAALGRTEELERAVDRALAATPTAGDAGAVLSRAAAELRAHGHPQAARKTAERAVAWYRSRPPQEAARRRLELARALVLAGRPEAALPVLSQAAGDRPEDPETAGRLGALRARLGDREGARAAEEALTGLHPECGEAEVYAARARIAAQLGETRRALDLLREAYARGFPHWVTTHCDPDLEPLWDDPGFRSLVSPSG